MTLQTSGTISMNEINREMKGYTASGTPIDLNDIQFRKMAAADSGALNVSAAISLADFYGDRSHIRLTTASHTSSGTTTIIRNGYIKDFFGTGSHLGSLHSSAGRFIPSTGASNNANEREVIACYTMHMYNSYGFNQKTFKLSLLGQVSSGNTFTGIREKLLNNNLYGQYTKSLSSATLYTGSTSNTWTWYISNLWTSATTRYIHWY